MVSGGLSARSAANTTGFAPQSNVAADKWQFPPKLLCLNFIFVCSLYADWLISTVIKLMLHGLRCKNLRTGSSPPHRTLLWDLMLKSSWHMTFPPPFSWDFSTDVCVYRCRECTAPNILMCCVIESYSGEPSAPTFEMMQNFEPELWRHGGSVLL